MLQNYILHYNDNLLQHHEFLDSNLLHSQKAHVFFLIQKPFPKSVDPVLYNILMTIYLTLAFSQQRIHELETKNSAV